MDWTIAPANSESAGFTRQCGRMRLRTNTRPDIANKDNPITIAGPETTSGSSKIGLNMLRLSRARFGSFRQIRIDHSRGFRHRAGPSRWRYLRAFDFVVDAGKFPCVQPNAAALRTLIDLDFFSLGEPLALEHLLCAAGTHPWPGEIELSARRLPDRMERSCGAGVHALKFRRIEPDPAAATVTDVESHSAGGLFAKRTLTRWT